MFCHQGSFSCCLFLLGMTHFQLETLGIQDQPVKYTHCIWIELQLKGKYNYYKINDCMEFFLISSVLYPPLQARWFPFLKNYPFFFTNIFQGPALPVDSCCLKCPTTNCSDLDRIAWFLCSLTKALVSLYQGTVAAYRIKQSFTLWRWGIKFPSFSFKDAPSLHLLHCMLNSCHFVYLVWFAIWCKTE